MLSDLSTMVWFLPHAMLSMTGEAGLLDAELEDGELLIGEELTDELLWAGLPGEVVHPARAANIKHPNIKIVHLLFIFPPIY